MVKNKRKNSASSANNWQSHVITDSGSLVAERYRTLRTNIEFSMREREIRSILVASAGPGEGKTTTAANLAVVYAQTGRNTVYLDCDLRSPAGHKAFNVANPMGMTNILTGKSVPSEVVQKVEAVPHLYVITSGPIPPNPAELLGSANMVEIMQTLYNIFDVIIIDSPPIVNVTDAQIISRHVDGVLVVARSRKTDKRALMKARKLLEQVRANIIGSVMNSVEAEESAYYYSYYYAEE
ncbi:MAG: CpsD/CapB family tyrosine-protein kinase [Streptococcaceae bacterium]|jgi:capsular exopolysaccharide synthesis family protein|nr:CpsD/CapB family tyrosine-protein kinase [Streptococcaceae bacterium]